MNKIPVPQDTIFEFSCDTFLCDEYVQKIKSSDKINYKKTIQLHQNDVNLLKNAVPNCYFGYPIPRYDELFDWLQQCVDKVSVQKFGTLNQSICDAWITKTLFSGHSPKHAHSFSVFSGLLYLNDHETQTEFYPADYFYMSQMRTIPINTAENIQVIRYKPKAGTLLIFPSYLEHKITPSKSKITRYSLAFNTFFYGNISESDTMRLFLNPSKNFYIE